MTATFFIYRITPNLSFLPDGLNWRFPVRALGGWT
jgi:hypothetical protein